MPATNLLVFHEGRRARRLGLCGIPPEPWRWLPLSCSWIRGWSVEDAIIRGVHNHAHHYSQNA